MMIALSLALGGEKFVEQGGAGGGSFNTRVEIWGKETREDWILGYVWNKVEIKS